MNLLTREEYMLLVCLSEDTQERALRRLYIHATGMVVANSGFKAMIDKLMRDGMVEEREFYPAGVGVGNLYRRTMVGEEMHMMMRSDYARLAAFGLEAK